MLFLFNLHSFQGINYNCIILIFSVMDNILQNMLRNMFYSKGKKCPDLAKSGHR